MLNKKMRVLITFILLALLLITCVFIIAKYINWLWIIGVVTISFGTLTALIIFSSRRPLRTKISWIIAVYALPIVGIIIFIIFGRTYRYTKVQKFYLKKYQDFYNKEDFNYTKEFLKKAPKELSNFIKLTTNISQRPFYKDTKVDLITNGIEKFTLLFKDFENAKSYIHINYFLLEDGEILKHLAQLLINKAYQGIKIRFIYDHAGSFFTVYHDTIQKLKRAGINLKRFSPINLPFISGRNNYRNHRKDVIIDGKIGYTGGMNVGDNYCHLSSKYGFWRDSQVRLQGSAVRTLELIFLQDWYFTTGESLVFDPRLLKTEPYATDSKNVVQIIDDGPNTYETIQKDIYVKVISSAKNRVWLSTPYFIPTDDIITALKNAAQSGVDVRLLMPGRTDKIFILNISRSYYEELFAAGIKIYEMNGVFNHSKTALIDDKIVIIGSTNLDFRSLYHDHQTIVILYGDANKKLEKNYLWDMNHSILLKESPLKTKNWFYRVIILPIVKIFDPLF